MWKKIVFGVALVISIAAGFGVAKVQNTMNTSLNHITRDKDNVLKDVNLDGIHVNSDDKIVNILLIGYDLRKKMEKTLAG